MFNDAKSFVASLPAGFGHAVFSLEGAQIGPRHLHLALHAGEVLRVCGGSLHARMLVLALAAGFVHDGAGCSRILGEDMRRLPHGARECFCTRNIGRRLSFDTVEPGTGAVDAVMAPLLAGGEDRACARHRARRQLDALGLPSLARRRDATALSAAQWQIVLCARAIVARPRLIVLDHPESGLPEGSIAALRDELAQASLEDDCAIVFTTEHPGLGRLATRWLDLDGAVSR